MADAAKQIGAIQAKLQTSSVAFQKLEGGELIGYSDLDHYLRFLRASDGV